MTAAVAIAPVLGRPVLVLNKSWQPMHVTSVQEAISLVAKGSAMIMDPVTFQTHMLDSWDAVSRAKQLFEGRVIRSSRLVLVEPEVILLTGYEGQGERSVVFSRRNIFKRDRHCCQYCGVQPKLKELTVDHVMPKSRGGRGEWTNCVLACVECNKRKSNRTPDEAGMRLRRKPTKPTWASLSQVPPKVRRESWKQFLDRAYWDTTLQP